MHKTIQLGVKRLHPDAIIPQYAHHDDACFDLHALSYAHVGRHEPSIIRTGLAFDIPAGHVLLIYSRSGHGFKSGVRLSNSVGVIDQGFIGEIMVKLTSDEVSLHVAQGDRIAQAMLVPLPAVQLVEIDELKDSARGASGFGSTGQ